MSSVWRVLRLRRFALVASVILCFRLAAATPAYAETMPPNNWSFYVNVNDTEGSGGQLGCNQARYDMDVHHESFVTLAFGAQTPNGSGTYLPGTTNYWSNLTIEHYAEWFAFGYWYCANQGTSGYILTMAVGTSNDGGVVDGAVGAVWGSVVSTVNYYVYPDVAVWGASDAEPGFGSFAHFQGWEWGDSSGGGYVSTSSLPVSDFGSADGCPTSLTYANSYCDNGWYVYSAYQAAWGWAPNWATPEIYVPQQPLQWANISAFGGIVAGSYGQIGFEGPLSTQAGFTPSQSWSAFVSALDNDADYSYMPFLMQIIWGK